MPTLTQNDPLSVAVARKQLAENLKTRIEKRISHSGRRRRPLNPNAVVSILGVRNKRRSIQHEILSMVAGAVHLVNL